MKKNYPRYSQFIVLAAFLLLSFAAAPYLFNPGIDTAKPVGPYLNGVFPSKTPTGSIDVTASYGIENAFPNITFKDPVDMVELPGGNEFLVVGLRGHIWKIQNSPETEKQLLLDVSDNVVSIADGGMLGIVLHPEYGQAGSSNSEYIYVFYRYTPAQGNGHLGYSRLSRFNLPPGSNIINPNSEEVLINNYDRHDWHNGGDMFFGPEDGFLYLVVGDEGGARDQYGVTQQIDKWLYGGILRIDVDRRGGNISHPIRRQPLNSGNPPAGWPDSFTQGYYIPNDNPWLDVNGGILEEFYAIGTRSPHRMTLDAQTGDIWIGDIGQAGKEEISVVRKADNLQWPYREGDQNGFTTMPEDLIGNDRPPIHAYDRTIGRAIIGGFVYRGNRYPEIKDKYIFGDHVTQNVWTLTRTGENSGTRNSLLTVPVEGVGGKDGISSFFTDSDGYIYILDMFGSNLDGGKIHRVVRQGTVVDPPQRLSQLNVFTNLETLETIDGIIPYDVNTPLWSDGAEKRRWIALPNDGAHDSSAEQISFAKEENWDFPAGTVAIKHFELPTNENNPNQITKLETRFLVFNEDNGAYAVTYKWNAEQTDAFLIGIDENVSEVYKVTKSDGSTVNQTWNFPTRDQCIQCHTSVAGYSLGLKTRQLNKDKLYPSGITSNQLETWSHLNIFDTDIDNIDQLPALASIDNRNATSEMKVRSYIDANCAYCHRPNGVNGAFDGRSMTSLYDQLLINQEVISNASTPGQKIIIPQDVLHSELYVRDVSIGDNRMPPIGRNLTDEDYINLLSGWIETLDENGPKFIADGSYTLKSRRSNKFLAIENGSASENSSVVQISSDQEDYAQWQVQHMGNNKYRINTGHSNKVMTLEDARTDKGVFVVQKTWNRSQQQLWYFQEAENGYFRIINAYNGLELDIHQNRTTENQPIVAWTPNGNSSQQWLIEERTNSDFNAIGETDIVKTDHRWKTVTLNGDYTDPVVIAGAPSFAGSNQSTVRVKNVTPTSFQIRIDEWECLDEFHIVEEIPYVVVEAGNYNLPNGSILKAGNIDALKDSWQTFTFSEAFNKEPIVLGQCVTENEKEAVNVFFDEKNTSESQFKIKLTEKDRATGGHVNERVSWIAVEPGASADTDFKYEMGNTGRTVNHNWKTINFEQSYNENRIFIGELGSEYGGDAATIRFNNLTNNTVRVKVEEETCGDNETRHTTEEIHYLVFDNAGDILGRERNESTPVNLVASLSETSFYFRDFKIENQPYMTAITWEVEYDKNIETYVIEYSKDGHNYEVVSDQPSLRSEHQAAYTDQDENVLVGKTIYRIVAITNTGEKIYSHPIENEFTLSSNRILIFPSPVAQTGVLTVDIVIDDIEDLTLSIYSLEGRLLEQRVKRMDQIQAFEQFSAAKFTSGVYFIEVKGSDWKQTRKFIIK